MNTTSVRINLMQALNALSTVCYNASKDAGWYNDPVTGAPIEPDVPRMLLLIHSEISEAVEGYRRDLPDTHLTHRPMIEVELADAIHRICDLAGALGLDLGGALIEKMQYNKTRSDHQREARNATNGKKF